MMASVIGYDTLFVRAITCRPPTPKNDPSFVNVTPYRTMTMKHIDIRRMFGAAVSIGGLTLGACAGAAQRHGGPEGGMMGGNDGYGWMGGSGGLWMLILVVVIAALVAWIVARGRNNKN